MNVDTAKQYGLVLEGGGARGAYQIGAWKALKEIGVNIKGVVGTSVGALNGALIAQGDFEAAYHIWSSLTYSKVINVDDNVMEKILSFTIKKTDIKLIRNTIRSIIKNNGLDITPLKKMIEEVVDEDKLRLSNIEYGLVTVSISDFRPMTLYLTDIKEGLLKDYLLASSYLPIFKSEKLHGKLYIDGGFYDNVPKKMLIDKGYKDIIIIKIHGLGLEQRCQLPDDVNITIIEPKENLGGVLEFDKDNTKYNLELGYYDTLRTLKGLKGYKYYIDADFSEDFFIHELVNINDELKDRLINRFGNGKKPLQRDFFENAIPSMAKRMKFKNNWRYEDVMIKLLEYLAYKKGVERFQIYKYHDFKHLAGF